MLISSKGRYALRLMVCVASAGPSGIISLREVSVREDLSLKYLEQVARQMMARGLLESVRGKGGGYRLSRLPSLISAGEVLRAAEGTTSPVACAGISHDRECPRSSACSTLGFWSGLDELIEAYVDAVSLQDLLSSQSQQICANTANMLQHVYTSIETSSC